jgi:hypothetical protein
VRISLYGECAKNVKEAIHPGLFSDISAGSARVLSRAAEMRKSRGKSVEMLYMDVPNGFSLVLIAAGGAVMFYVMISAIGRTAVATAGNQIDIRRALEAKRREEDALAEAAGRAAALEPLNLNPDGSVEEPILGEVEGPR